MGNAAKTPVRRNSFKPQSPRLIDQFRPGNEVVDDIEDMDSDLNKKS